MSPGTARVADKGDGSRPVGASEQERARALALLEATHQFPCQYTVTIIAFNTDPVTAAVKAAVAEAASDHEHHAIESKAGKYLSHRFAVKASGAAHVLEIYARVRTIEGVVTVL
jgi:putative lipoic acid-binding regulatory protein